MAKEKVARSILVNRWLHSHEEDSGGRIVYRSVAYPFPRSRGRSGFELKDDGSYVEIGIAATDRPEEIEGSWEITEDDTLILTCRTIKVAVKRMRILSARPDRLEAER